MWAVGEGGGESLRQLTPYTLSSVAALARLELGIVSRLQAGTRDRVRTERQVPWAGPPDNYATLMSQLQTVGPAGGSETARSGLPTRWDYPGALTAGR